MNRGILLFTAGWCEHCKVITPLLESMSNKGKINFKKVNVDYDASTTSNYNVKSVPTVILITFGFSCFYNVSQNA